MSALSQHWPLLDHDDIDNVNDDSEVVMMMTASEMNCILCRNCVDDDNNNNNNGGGRAVFISILLTHCTQCTSESHNIERYGARLFT